MDTPRRPDSDKTVRGQLADCFRIVRFAAKDTKEEGKKLILRTVVFRGKSNSRQAVHGLSADRLVRVRSAGVYLSTSTNAILSRLRARTEKVIGTEKLRRR